MNKTSYYDLPLYEPNDAPSLIDGYNNAVLTIDSALHAIENDIKLLTKRIETLEKKR